MNNADLPNGRYRAVHLSDGNLFDDMRIDIQRSFEVQDHWLQTVKKISPRKSRIANYRRLAQYLAFNRLGLHDPMVNVGLIHDWFDEFSEYWTNVLEGRPITLQDFHHLHFHYRQKSQYTSSLNWDTHTQHLENWQTPDNISAIFRFVDRTARHPIRSRRLWRILKPGMRAVEYGCSLAPMYKTWRLFLNHIDVEWVLADLPNFPFHYARHVYGRDDCAIFSTITPDRFDDPLQEAQGAFDLIIIQTVFEHLHNPRHIAAYMIDRLKKGGLLYFDYIRSEAQGHDTPQAQTQRIETLEYLARHLTIVYGHFEISEKSLSSCVGTKK